MTITLDMLVAKLQWLAKKNAPVRKISKTKDGKRNKTRAVGKKGTNMYSPYPGNLKNNGIVPITDGVVYDYNRVGYIGYADLHSHKPQFIEKTVEDFCRYCIGLGGRMG